MENLEKIEQIKNPKEALDGLENKELLSIVKGEKIPFIFENANEKEITNLCFNLNKILDNYGNFSELLKRNEEKPIGLNKQLA